VPIRNFIPGSDLDSAVPQHTRKERFPNLSKFINAIAPRAINGQHTLRGDFLPLVLALKRSTLSPIALVRVLGIEKQKQRGVSYENG